jgi:hypothetical protein
MSAVIAFPKNPRAVSAARRTVKQALDERAKATNATLEQRRVALAAALDELGNGRSIAWAIQEGRKKLPQPTRPTHRQPTDPRPAA